MSFIDHVFDGGALPTLERTVEFTAQRHRLIVDNIANINTPGYKPKDLDVADFQEALRKSIERRDSAHASERSARRGQRSGSATVSSEGVDVEPTGLHENVLFHDGNNRDVERIMQDLAENTLAHSSALRFLQSELGILKTAIRERI